MSQYPPPDLFDHDRRLECDPCHWGQVPGRTPLLPEEEEWHAHFVDALSSRHPSAEIRSRISIHPTFCAKHWVLARDLAVIYYGVDNDGVTLVRGQGRYDAPCVGFDSDGQLEYRK